MMSEKTKDRGNKGQTQKDRPRMFARMLKKPQWVYNPIFDS